MEKDAMRARFIHVTLLAFAVQASMSYPNVADTCGKADCSRKGSAHQQEDVVSLFQMTNEMTQRIRGMATLQPVSLQQNKSNPDLLKAMAAAIAKMTGGASAPKSTPAPTPLLHKVPGDTDLYALTPLLTNILAALIAVVLLGSVYAGHRYDDGHSPFPKWTIVITVLSYASWFFGFYMTSTSYEMVVRTPSGHKLFTTHPLLHPHVDGIFRESPHHLISGLIKSPKRKAQSAGYAFACFAIGDPFLKLLLMIMGEVLRRRDGYESWSRSCIFTLQFLTKWAAPLCFYIALMQCQFLAMNDDYDVSTKSVLDLGYVGAMFFCITNVVSALSIRPPELNTKCKPEPSLATRNFGKNGVAYFVAFLSLLYFAFMSIGIFSPVLSYKVLPETALYASKDAIKIMETTAISLWDCFTMLLARSVQSIQLIPLLAAFVFFVFLILLPVIDMCAMVATCFYARYDNSQAALKSIVISRKTRRSLMLDVTLVAFGLASLADTLILHKGCVMLFWSEIIRHAVLYGIVYGIDEEHEARVKEELEAGKKAER